MEISDSFPQIFWMNQGQKQQTDKNWRSEITQLQLPGL